MIQINLFRGDFLNYFIKQQLKAAEMIFENWMKKRASEGIVSDDIEIISNIPYIDDGNSCHMLDIYRPARASEPLPVIANLHGGGFLLCTKEVNRPFCLELAKRGFLVFCIDYPLVPDVDMYQILSDVSLSLNVVHNLIAEYGGDASHVYLTGDSAGAFLSIYIAASQKNPAIAHAGHFQVPTLPIKALGLISGMFYTTKMDSIGLFLKKDFYGKDYKKHPFYKYVSPECSEIAGNLPPCFFVTSKSDNLHKHTMDLLKGLKAHNGTWEILDFPLSKRLQHDFVIISLESNDSQQAIDEIVGFLKKY